MNFTNPAAKGLQKGSRKAFADWWYGRTKGGVDSLYVDRRTPNGGGTYIASESTKWHLCVKTPAMTYVLQFSRVLFACLGFSILIMRLCGSFQTPFNMPGSKPMD